MDTQKNTPGNKPEDHVIGNPVEDYGLQCNCTIINSLSIPLALSSAPSPNDGSYIQGPVGTIGANSNVQAFDVAGLHNSWTGPSGTVSYSFVGIYGTVTCLITYNVPWGKSNNTFTAVLQGPATGSSGSYDCSFSGAGHSNVVNGYVNISFI